MPYSVLRLIAAVGLMTIGSGAMYIVVVVLPMVQEEFGADRAGASLPYTLTMLGFGFGGILMGKLADRFGVFWPVLIGVLGLSSGYWLAAQAGSLLMFAIVHGLLLGLAGSSATFAPLVADISFWFERRRGIAVAIVASGNYIAGAIWPPIVQHFSATYGWRATYSGFALFTLVTMLPLATLVLRRPPPAADALPAGGAGTTPAAAGATATVFRPQGRSPRELLGISSTSLQTLLLVAGVACCVAMSMPQVHIVAYCGDLGYGTAAGARMLSLMLACGIVSRLVSGVICDRIGGLRTLLLGSVLQGLSLMLFLPFDSLASLYLLSAIFGLVQGGIVPAYAIIVREFFDSREAGVRVGLTLTATLVGMALGGWLSGKIFDLTGSYEAAFVNGIGWNLLNGSIILFLLLRQRRWRGLQAAGHPA